MALLLSSSIAFAFLSVFLYWLLCPVLDPYENVAKVTSGQHVFITGASQGIGRSLVTEYAKKGASKITIVARNEERLRQAKYDVESAYPNTTIFVIPADLSTEESCYNVIESSIEAMDGKLDVLLLNHITSSKYGTWLEVQKKEKFLVDMFHINFFSYVWAVTAAIETLKKSTNGGHTGIVSSLNGHVGMPKTASYTATKHALHGFFNAFRLELEYLGINNVSVTLCAIGATDTEGSAVVKDKLHPSLSWDPPEWAAESIVRGVALKVREIYHPQHVVFPSIHIYNIIPYFFERILLKTLI